MPPGTSSNVLSGSTGGPVIQAGSIGGDVHFHTAAAHGTVPRQLPRPPACFIDRFCPLSVISEAAATASTGAPELVVLSGAGGMGKTALALRGLHRAAGLFPGGQLYADLGGFSATGRVPEDAVISRWLRALGIHPTAVPADPGEAAALYRTLTAAASVTVLADDAADEDQVRALLPAAGLMVVTSRYLMPGLVALDGARLLTVGPLDAPAAAKLAGLISGRAGAAPGALAELAAWCGGMPLAIRTASARLMIRPGLTLQQVTGELAAAGYRLRVLETSDPKGLVTAAMQTSYDDLGPAARRACRLLSGHPGKDFTADAAAAMLDLDPGPAETLISDLAGASLLTETSPGRYQFHDLFAEHARDIAARHDQAGDRLAAIARVTEFYARTSAAADLAVLTGRLRIAPAYGLPRCNQPAYDNPADALAWLDTEISNMAGAQQAAARLGLHTMAWQFADTLWGWCVRRSDYPVWQAIDQQAIDSARACGDARAEVFCATRLACCLLGRGDVQAAAGIAATAITTAVASGDRAGEASAREQAGNCDLIRADYPAAIAHFERGIDCWRRITAHHRGEAILHRQLGRAWAGLGDTAQAETHLDAALGIFTRLGEPYHRARTLYAIGQIRLEAGHPGAALTVLEQARPLMEDEDHRLGLSELLTLLASAHAQTGDPSRARACLAAATTIQHTLHLASTHPARARTLALEAQLPAPADDRPDDAG